MWRYLILLIPAAPLLIVGYFQGEILFGMEWRRPTILSDANLDRCEKDLDDASKKTNSRGRPGPVLLACLLRTEDHCPKVDPAESEFTREMLPPTEKHAEGLAEVRRLFSACADPNAEPGAVTNAKYKQILENRQKVRVMEREIDALCKNVADEAKLLDRLHQYKNLSGASSAFIRDVEARIERRKIAGLDSLPAAVDKVLAGGTAGTVGRSIDTVIGQLKEYSKTFAAKREEADWASAELQRWERTRKLLRLFERNADQDSPSKVKAQFAAYAALQSADDPGPEFRAWVRTAVIHLCSSYLSDKPLPLDDVVKIRQGDDVHRVARKDVQIQWKGKGNERESLADTKLDEFTLQHSKVNFYWDGKKKAAYDGPMEATTLSKAANRYNVERKKLKWSADSLRELLRETEYYLTELKDVRERAETLLELIKDHRDLIEK